MTRNKKIATILGVLAGAAFISSASIPIIFHAKESNETRNSRKKDIQYLENLIKLKNEQEVNNNKFLLEKKLDLEQLEIKRNNVEQVINLLIGKNYDKNINQLHKNNLDNKSLVYYLFSNIDELTSEKDLLENNNKELLARLNEIKSSFDNEKNELVNQINNLKQENKELLKEKNNLLKQQKYLLWIYQSRISTLKDAIATINGEFKIKENNYKETIARLNEEKNRLISEADNLRNNLNIKRVELETANNKLKTSTSKLVELLSSVININSLFEVLNETFVSNEILDNLVITSETEINSVIESNSLDNYLTTSLFLSNQILDNLNKVISNNKKIESNSIETNNLYKSKLSELLGESEEYSIGDNGKEALENSIVYNLRKQINDISLLINDNKAKIKQLEIDVDSLTNQIESKTQNNQDLARQISDISNSITEKNRIIESLNSEIQASKSLKSSNNENIEKYKSMLISLIGTDDKDFNFDNLAEAAQNGIVKQLHQKYNEKEQEKNELISRFETEKELLNN
ncbi:Uncharacterised protein [Mycoplasmopsis maculosa]|uniref:Uncharacterized protein n=1 Tax=Mycoplasmopsis maculosa TaxID=114885 RepID=A0A449B4Q8_9BACT|nr:hypothetical protein [Mycoplasmopsis maculosa]VEU75591.1 Uncharacterised protein [Mycoplasmopsis maculosa]